MDRIIHLYRSLCLVPTLVGAKLDRSGNIVHSIWSHRNLERSKTTKYLKYILLGSDLQKEQELIPIDVSNELLSSFSPSESFKAILRENDEKQYLEIWKKDNLFRTVDLSVLDIHGKVYCDGDFSTIQWSPNETKLLYVAEKKLPDSKPFYKRKAKEEGNDEKKPGQEYIFRQDWGEQMVGKRTSVIVEYNINDDKANIIEGIPDDVCPGQVKFSPDGEYIVGVAYKTETRKLGLIYCSNRPANIFKLRDGKYETISYEDRAARYPIFTPDGKSILYVEREAKGPHMAGVELVQRDFLSSDLTTQKIIVPIVEEEIEIENNEKFYGLYNLIISKRCWGSGNRLIFSTNQKNSIESFVIDLDNGNIMRLPHESGSLIVLDVCNDVVLANSRDFLKGDTLVIGKLPPKGQEQSISWTELTPKKKLNTLKDHKYEYLDLRQNVEDSVKNFSAIYVGPSSGADKSVPLIVYPHGGPHSAFANNFSLDISFSLSNGFAVLLINYRGSIGAGNGGVNFLLGRIGVTDVSDCILATNEALKKCYVECGKEYTQKGPVDDEILLRMRKCSPLVHAHKVRAPTMLQVGLNDLRVPPGQSMEYFHRLKANGIEVSMHTYDDNHPLGQVKNEMDNLINTVLWLNKHIGKENSE